MPIGHSEQASHLRAVLSIVRTRRHNRGCCYEAVETRLVFLFFRWASRKPDARGAVMFPISEVR